MSDWKTQQNQNPTAKFPAVNISTKMNNSKISNSKKLDEKKNWR